jgi:hypothetical protein
MRLRDIGRAIVYRRLPQLASPATDSPANRDTASGRKNFIVLDKAMIGTLNPEVRGTIKSGRSPTNSVWPEPVATKAAVRMTEKRATMQRVA